MEIFCFIPKNGQTHCTRTFLRTFFFLFNIDIKDSLPKYFNTEIQKTYFPFFTLKPSKISFPRQNDVFKQYSFAKNGHTSECH